ncbi:MAG: response regulator [Acidobacteria bacterium]|nr:response regulator [Acidobacteriota bacterium]
MSAFLATDSTARRSAPGSKVLVAEDHEDTRALLRTLLERRGLAVVEARDGEEACDLALRERPDLILMDGGLPLLDGFAATRRMRDLKSLAGIPIVFLSGHAGPQYQLAAHDAGCDEYVVKPFDIAQLDSILSRHLHVSGRRTNEGVRPTLMTHGGLSGDARREGVLPSPKAAAGRKLYGLIEIDQAGTVLYTRFEGEAAAAFAALGATGRNFYTELAPFRNVGEFRQQLDAFRKGAQPAHTIDFTCDYADGPLPVRVLLARIRERSEQDVTNSILVHIRRAH